MERRVSAIRMAVVAQRELPPISYRSGSDFQILAEHIYGLLIMSHFDSDWDVRGIVTYVLDSDWLGFAPERQCGCDRCQACNANLRWEDIAYELMNEIINNFVPPPSGLDYDEDTPVRLLPPNAIAVPVNLQPASRLPYMEGCEVRPADAPVP